MLTKNIMLIEADRAIPGKRFTDIDTNDHYAFGHLIDKGDYTEGVLHINSYKTTYRLIDRDSLPYMVLDGVEYPMMAVSSEAFPMGDPRYENIRFIVGTIDKNKSFALYP